MLITPPQIKAARAMIDWSAEELGKRVNVAKTTISAIETGRSRGSIEVITAITYALQSGGIEFTADGGVRLKQGRLHIYKGREGFRAFFDEVYEVAKINLNSDICITNTDESMYEKWLGDYEPNHVKRMKGLSDLNMRVLVKEEDNYLTSSDYCTYRWVCEEGFADVSLYIYGDKSAFIEFLKNDVVVTVVDNKAVTKSLRKMFDVSWVNALTKGSV